MAKARKSGKGKKRKAKVVVKQKAQIVHKGDSLGVDTTGMKHAPTIVPSNIPVFKVKIRKK